MYSRNGVRKRRSRPATRTKRRTVIFTSLFLVTLAGWWQSFRLVFKTQNAVRQDSHKDTLLSEYKNMQNEAMWISQDKLIRRLPIPNNEFVPEPQRNVSVANKLEFVHITKTGGTAIEDAAARAGVVWGACHYQERMGCHSRFLGTDLGWPRTFSLQQRVIPYPNFTGEYWHTPPHWFVHNPWQGVPTFTVVRNPYDRYVSEFYCKYNGYFREMPRLQQLKEDPTDPADRLMFFERLKQQKEQLELRKAGQRRLSAAETNHDSNTTKADEEHQHAALLNKWIVQRLKKFQGDTGHFLPQHYYVYDANGTQVVMTHVLKYETLAKDFVMLMKHYQLNITLPPIPTHKEGRLTRKDLERETIKVINEFARDDFRLFGYDMMMDPASS